MLRASSVRFVVLFLVSMCPGLVFGQATVQLVPLPVASPSDTAASLPTAQTQFRVGDPFVVEMWAQTNDSGGLGQVSADVTFDPTVVSANSIVHTAAFNFFGGNGTIDNVAGLLDDVSGSHFVFPCDATGFAPNWARVAIFVMNADAAGQTVLQSADTANPLWIVTNCAGSIPPVTYGNVTIDVISAQVAVELVALSVSGASDLATTLPSSDAVFPRGKQFFVEMWAQTAASTGLSQVSADITFDPALLSSVTITHTPQFPLFQSGVIDNAGGLVDDVSGLHGIANPPCSDTLGFAPQWARVAIIEMVADQIGSFTLQSGTTNNPTFGASLCSSVLTPFVTYGSVSATIVLADCNNNGIDDAIDIADGSSLDRNGNGIPDECETPLPALSSWGLLALMLLVMIAGTVVFGRFKALR